jgi:hypothetical protein
MAGGLSWLPPSCLVRCKAAHPLHSAGAGIPTWLARAPHCCAPLNLGLLSADRNPKSVISKAAPGKAPGSSRAVYLLAQRHHALAFPMGPLHYSDHLSCCPVLTLQGGTTMFKDFGRRIQRDLKRAVDARTKGASSAVEVNVMSHPMQRYAVWFGGSVLGMSPGEWLDVRNGQGKGKKSRL